MFRIVTILFSIFLAGCVAPHPMAKVSNLSEKSLGDAMALALSTKTDNIVFDETGSFKHWKYGMPRFFSGPEHVNASIDSRLSYFDRYCNSLGGELSTPEVGEHGVREVRCKQSKTGAAIFRVYAMTEHCEYTPKSDPTYDKELPYYCRRYQLDAFAWKASTDLNFDSLYADYSYLSDFYGFQLLQVANQERERLRLRKLETEQARRERVKQLMADAERFISDRKAQAIRDLPKIKSTGQRICNTYQIDQRNVIGYARGKAVYSDPVATQAKVTAFTEQVSGSKIQIRISGIEANGENLDRIDGDVVLTNGAVIWDEAKNWKLCN